MGDDRHILEIVALHVVGNIKARCAHQYRCAGVGSVRHFSGAFTHPCKRERVDGVAFGLEDGFTRSQHQAPCQAPCKSR